MSKTIAVAAIQVAGAISITIGVGIISIPIGAIVGGILAIAFGVALEKTNVR